MAQKFFAPQPSIDVHGNRKFDPHFLTGRFVLNLSGCDIEIAPEPGSDVFNFLFKNGKKPIEKVTLAHGESKWLDNFFIVPTSIDGRRIILPQAFNADGLSKLKAAVKASNHKFS